MANRHCPACGARSEVAQRFCSECGAKLDTPGIAAASAPAGPPIARGSRFWACPVCHWDNDPEDATCPHCFRGDRPDGWLNGTWTCDRCGNETRNKQKYCEKCGQFPPQVRAARAGPEQPGPQIAGRMWECPVCHSAVAPDRAICSACRKGERPSGWLDRSWRCERCGHTNTVRDAQCQKCGEYAPDLRGARSPRCEDVPGRHGDGLAARGGVRSSVGGALAGLERELSSSLDDLRSQISSVRSDLGGSTRFQRVSARHAASSAEPDGRPGGADPVTDQRGASPLGPTPRRLERVTTRNLDVTVRCLPKLNFALFHAGLPVIQELRIRNAAAEPALDLLVRAWVATDYGEAWQRSVASIPARSVHEERDVVVPLTKARLQDVREAERANLKVEISSEGQLQWTNTFPLEVLAYNEWYFHPAIPQTIACFVQPNSPAIEQVVSMVRDRLRREGSSTELDGYQSGDAKKIEGVVRAFYATLQQDLELSYINPPPSFEHGERLADGDYALSQKIVFPEHIVEHRRGTCLDLAVFCCSCLERIGLHPLVYFIHGHAFFGVWLDETAWRAALDASGGSGVFHDAEALVSSSQSGACLALNSTTFAAAGMKPFEVCVLEASAFLAVPEVFRCGVDIAAARTNGVKPIPPLSGRARE